MEEEHKNMMEELGNQFKAIMDSSPEGIYLWFDDENKICNKNFADMLGYTMEEWQEIPDLLNQTVVEEDREKVAENYQKHIENLTNPVTFRIKVIKKDGTVFEVETDMIPISWGDHAIAYHFIRKIGE